MPGYRGSFSLSISSHIDIGRDSCLHGSLCGDGSLSNSVDTLSSFDSPIVPVASLEALPHNRTVLKRHNNFVVDSHFPVDDQNRKSLLGFGFPDGRWSSPKMQRVQLWDRSMGC